jgi:hypothetical protein
MKIRTLGFALLFVGMSFLTASARAALWTIDSVQTGGWDGYIHLYQNAFDPNNQLTNLLAGDDDGPGGIGTSQILNIDLAPGVYVLVTSGFAAGDAGPYDTTISGAGPTIMFSGDTTGGPLWDRPIGGGPSISGLGPVNYEAQSFTIGAVPEPGTLALLGLSLAGLAATRRRKP